MDRGEFIRLARSYIGYPSTHYRGPECGCDPSGFDCSGFIWFLLQRAGFPDDVPRHANEMFDRLGVLVHHECRLPGDLVFFTRNGLKPGHVGLIVSDTEYLHAPGKRNTVVEIHTLAECGVPAPPEGRRLFVRNPIGYKGIAYTQGRYQRFFLT